jgi:hypothetical protein
VPPEWIKNLELRLQNEIGNAELSHEGGELRIGLASYADY